MTAKTTAASTVTGVDTAQPPTWLTITQLREPIRASHEEQREPPTVVRRLFLVATDESERNAMAVRGLVGWFGRIGEKRVAWIIVLVAGLILTVSFIRGDDGPIGNSRVRPSAQPEDVLEQVASRDIWTSLPATFNSAKGVADAFRGDAAVPVARVNQARTVVTPEQIADHGVEFDGQDVIVVGRVADAVSLAPIARHALTGYAKLSAEVRLAGTRESGAYVGTLADEPTVRTRRGELVWVIARIAAIGWTRINGQLLRTAYLIAGSNFQTFDSASRDLLPTSVRRALAGQARRPRLR